MSKSDAIHHLNAAVRALRLDEDDNPNTTVADELRRIDSTIGPKGESIFGVIADCIQESLVEILAAKAELERVDAPLQQLVSAAKDVANTLAYTPERIDAMLRLKVAVKSLAPSL